MSEKTDTDRIRISQVASGALAAITAAVLGSTMGVAGTVAGAGLASVVTTVGGTLYLRSIHRTKQSVRSVRNLVVTRVGGQDVVVEEQRSEPAPDTTTATTETAEQPDEKAEDETKQEGDDQPPASRRLRWPALIAASVLAFTLGMLVVSGVELLRGKSLSGDGATTIGRIAQTDQDDGDKPDKAPPPSEESTTPPTDAPTGTDTSTPPTSEDEEPAPTSGEPTEPETTGPDTTTEAPPAGTESVPQGDEVG
jgi:hypothetical protein